MDKRDCLKEDYKAVPFECGGTRYGIQKNDSCQTGYHVRVLSGHGHILQYVAFCFMGDHTRRIELDICHILCYKVLKDPAVSDVQDVVRVPADVVG